MHFTTHLCQTLEDCAVSREVLGSISIGVTSEVMSSHLGCTL